MARNRQEKEIVPTKLVRIDRIFVASGLVITSGFSSSPFYRKHRPASDIIFIPEIPAVSSLVIGSAVMSILNTAINDFLRIHFNIGA